MIENLGKTISIALTFIMLFTTMPMAREVYADQNDISNSASTFENSEVVKKGAENSLTEKLLIQDAPPTIGLNSVIQCSVWDGVSISPIIPDGDVYNVSSAAQLAWLSQESNQKYNTFDDKTIKLCTNIDLNNSENWKELRIFSGNIDGQGFTIQNMKSPLVLSWHASTSNVNEISNVNFKNYQFEDSENGVIESIGTKENAYMRIRNCHFSGKLSQNIHLICGGAVYVSGAVGGIGNADEKKAYVLFQDVTTNTNGNGEINSSGAEGVAGGVVAVIGKNLEVEFVNVDAKGELRAYGTCEGYAGGIVGVAESPVSMKHCTWEGKIEGSCRNDAYAGGLVGYLHKNGDISDCIVKGEVFQKGNRFSNVGGFLGSAYGNLKIKNCKFIGNIASEGSYAGGIVGEIGGGNIDATIENCHSIGDIKSEYVAGGLVGLSGQSIGPNIYKCSSVGDITEGIEGFAGYAGGIVGSAMYPNISDSSALGTLKAAKSGGIIGSTYSAKIMNCYAKVSFVNATRGSVGGLIGEGNPVIVNSYFDTIIARQMESVGSAEVEFVDTFGRTSKEMKSKDNYVGWDFENVWSISAEKNGGYPCLMVNDGNLKPLPPYGPKALWYEVTKGSQIHESIKRVCHTNYQMYLDEKYFRKKINKWYNAWTGSNLSVNSETVYNQVFTILDQGSNKLIYDKYKTFYYEMLYDASTEKWLYDFATNIQRTCKESEELHNKWKNELNISCDITQLSVESIVALISDISVEDMASVFEEINNEYDIRKYTTEVYQFIIDSIKMLKKINEESKKIGLLDRITDSLYSVFDVPEVSVLSLPMGVAGMLIDMGEMETNLSNGRIRYNKYSKYLDDVNSNVDLTEMGYPRSVDRNIKNAWRAVDESFQKNQVLSVIESGNQAFGSWYLASFLNDLFVDKNPILFVWNNALMLATIPFNNDLKNADLFIRYTSANLCLQQAKKLYDESCIKITEILLNQNQGNGVTVSEQEFQNMQNQLRSSLVSIYLARGQSMEYERQLIRTFFPKNTAVILDASAPIQMKELADIVMNYHNITLSELLNIGGDKPNADGGKAQSDESGQLDEWNQNIVNRVMKSASGEIINVKMDETKDFSHDILAVLEGKDISILLDYGAYTWTINGQSIQGLLDNDKAYDLSVKLIHDQQLSESVEEKDAMQLEIAYDGEFPFTGVLTYAMEPRYEGKKVFLYYFNEDTGKKEYRGLSLVKNGKICFDFQRASKYIISTEITKGTKVHEVIPKEQNVYGYVAYLVRKESKKIVGFSALSESQLIFEAPSTGVYEFQNNTKHFGDTKEHWAKNSIDFVTSRELFLGTETNQFSPEGIMTRGMLVTVLGKLQDVDISDYAEQTDFSDVDKSLYYTPYVAWAVKNGIAHGTGKNRFSPDEPITRQELAVIMSNYADLKKIRLLSKNEAVTFADDAEVAKWADKEVAVMQLAGIMSGVGNNRFAPCELSTRAQVATVLQKFINISVESEAKSLVSKKMVN